MKTQTPHSAELRQLCDLIEPISVPMLTGSDGEATLESRPMSPLEMNADGTIWFLSNLRSAKVEHLGALNLSFADHATSTLVRRRAAVNCTPIAALSKGCGGPRPGPGFRRAIIHGTWPC